MNWLASLSFSDAAMIFMGVLVGFVFGGAGRRKRKTGATANRATNFRQVTDVRYRAGNF